VEIDEVAARLLRQYWALLLVCVLVPLATISFVVSKQSPMYAADARIVTGSAVPQSSAEADAIVSQVQAIATGRTAAARALQAAGARRNLTDFSANHISVSGLGSSQVVDLTVTDRSPQVAEQVARVLAAEVIGSVNDVGQSGLSEALKAIDQEIVRLTQKRASLTAQVTADPRNQQQQAKLAGLDEVIANFTGDRGRLLIQASTQGLATVIVQPNLPVRPESKALAQKLGLAGLLGLVVGILLASIAEVARPTVPGARRVSRRLGAPALGQLSSEDMIGHRTKGLDNLALRLRLAAMHSGASTIALADVDGERDLDDLAAGLERALLESSPGGPAGLGSVSANNHGHEAAERISVGVGSSAILVRSSPQAAADPVLRIRPLGQMKRPAEMGRVEILVLSGPVARVSRITALEDLVASSGWPIIGVVGVPRMGSRQKVQRAKQAARVRRSVSGSSALNGADAANGAKGRDL
jgi:capsular polysaccharide biosynthesis protein